MTRSLVACLALSTAAAMTAFATCLASGGGLAAAIGLYVVTGSAGTLLLASLLAVLRTLAPARVARRPRAEAPAYA